MAQQVFYTPNGLANEAQSAGYASVWNITVTGGALQSGGYDAWCFSMDLPGYESGDYGHPFESTVIAINNLISFQGSPGTNKAGAMINYLFDNYYGNWNQPGLNTAEITERILSFHHVLWEIQRDYNPEFGFSTIDFSAGQHTVGANQTLDLMFSDLSSTYAGLSQSYTSAIYQLHGISGSNVLKSGSPVSGEIQPLIVVSVIPEPSSMMLGGLAVGLLALRRRRPAAHR